MQLRNKISIIGQELFQISLIAYLFLVLAENFWPGSVSNFFNLNILLGVSLFTGIMTIVGEPSEQEIREYKKEQRERFVRTFDGVVRKIRF